MSAEQQVPLEIARPCYQGGVTSTPIQRSLPLYRRATAGCYVHRIRSAALHLDRRGERKGHVSYSFWCGSAGFLHKKNGAPTADVAPHEILCATCEGRAVGAGLPPIGLLMLRPVKFAPRR